MLRYIISKDAKFNGLLYRGRKIIADEKLLKVLAKVPEAIVYSSWRSLAEQKVLFQQGKSKTMKSNHMRGLAVDVINWKDVEKKMNKVGLINDISWDKNHFALGGEVKAAKEVIYDKLPDNLKEFKIETPQSIQKTPKPIQMTTKPIQVPSEEIKTPEIVISSVTEQTATNYEISDANNATSTPIPEVQAVSGDIPMQEEVVPMQKNIWSLIKELIIKLWNK